MKTLYKTIGWAIVSGVIFMASALVHGCPWESALFATACATALKTPAYTVYEFVFERCWKKGGASSNTIEEFQCTSTEPVSV